MSTAGDLLRTTDFPNGIQTAADVQRLGNLLNPRLKALEALAAHGVNVAKHWDADPISFQVVTPNVAWSLTPDVAPCFPQKVRIADRRVPFMVLLASCRDHNQASGVTPAIAATGVQWSYLGTAHPGDPNLLSIDAIPGLAVNRTYDVTVVVLYA